MNEEEMKAEFEKVLPKIQDLTQRIAELSVEWTKEMLKEEFTDSEIARIWFCALQYMMNKMLKECGVKAPFPIDIYG